MSITKKDVLLFLNPLYFENDEVKLKFSKWYAEYKIIQIRSVTLLTALLYIVGSQVTQNLAPISIQGFMLAWQLYVMPITLIVISALTLQVKFHRLVNILLAMAPVFANCANLYIVSHVAEFEIFLPEVYLSVIWIFAVSGLSLIYATISASTIFFIVALGGYFLGFHRDVYLMHLLWLFSSFSFGLLSAFLLEKSHILTFINGNKLEYIATTDSLTGIYNRLKIESIINEEIGRVARYNRKLSVILLDLDHFKNINDNYGHHVGDVVLKEVSLVLGNSIRNVDEIARWGGEEFVIMLPETKIEDAKKVAEHIRQKIENHAFPVINSQTASFGVTEYVAGDSLQTVIIRADKALYKAKENGRNQIKSL